MIVLGLSLENWSYVATIASVLGAAIAFALNVRSQIKQRSIDNCQRYLEYHSALFARDGYLDANVAAMEGRTFKRDLNDAKMEERFREMLSAFENFALLQRAGGAPTSINSYMLGYFVKHIFAALTDREKAEPYWELAIDFLNDVKRQADVLDNMSKTERLKYISRNHF